MRMLNWLNIEHHTALLSEPTVYSLYCGLRMLFIVMLCKYSLHELEDCKNNEFLSNSKFVKHDQIFEDVVAVLKLCVLLEPCNKG